MIDIKKLDIKSPRGKRIFVGADFSVQQGEVLVLLGPSGAGKSTLSQFIFDKRLLLESGFEIDYDLFSNNDASISMIPQKGALFDHLNVFENVDLAARYSQGSQRSANEWMKHTGCNPEWVTQNIGTHDISGGEAQRVAVARSLASGSDTVVMDEPTVGLDPGRVNALAKTILGRQKNDATTFVVVTHDIHFAVSVADRFLYVGDASGQIVELYKDAWDRNELNIDDDPIVHGEWVAKLHSEMDRRVGLLTRSSQKTSGIKKKKNNRGASIGALGLLGISFIQLLPLVLTKTRDFFKIFLKSLWIALLRPLPFYVFVSTLLGATILYIVSSVGGAGLRPGALIEQMGGAHVLALAPALSGVLFSAVSANGINAWLGQFELSKQSLALRALGIAKETYLLVPLFWGLVLSYLVSAFIFIGGMLLGGWLLCELKNIDNGWPMLLGDFLDPRPGRGIYLKRASVLLLLYGGGISLESIVRGTRKKFRSQDVTEAMTTSVIVSTLWIVFLELVTLVIVQQ